MRDRAATSRGTGESGFSLVETAVAFLVAALLALSGLQLVRSGANSNFNLSRPLQETEGIRSIQHVLRELSGMQRLTVAQPGRLEGVVRAPNGSTYTVIYEARADGLYRVSGSQQEKLGELQGVAFSYFDSAGNPTSDPARVARIAIRQPGNTMNLTAASLTGQVEGASGTRQVTRQFPAAASPSPKDVVVYWDDVATFSSWRATMLPGGSVINVRDHTISVLPLLQSDMGLIEWRAIWGTGGALGDRRLSCRDQTGAWQTSGFARSPRRSFYPDLWQWGVTRCAWDQW